MADDPSTRKKIKMVAHSMAMLLAMIETRVIPTNLLATPPTEPFLAAITKAKQSGARYIFRAMLEGGDLNPLLDEVVTGINTTLIGDDPRYVVCEKCGDWLYAKQDDWTVDDAMEEHRRLFGFVPSDDDSLGTLCERCFEQFVGWAQQQGIIQGARVN